MQVKCTLSSYVGRQLNLDTTRASSPTTFRAFYRGARTVVPPLTLNCRVGCDLDRKRVCGMVRDLTVVSISFRLTGVSPYQGHA